MTGDPLWDQGGARLPQGPSAYSVPSARRFTRLPSRSKLGNNTCQGEDSIVCPTRVNPLRAVKIPEGPQAEL